MKKIFESPVVEVKSFTQDNEVMAAGVFTLAKSATAVKDVKTTYIIDKKLDSEVIDGYDYWVK